MLSYSARASEIVTVLSLVSSGLAASAIVVPDGGVVRLGVPWAPLLLSTRTAIEVLLPLCAMLRSLFLVRGGTDAGNNHPALFS